MNPVPPADVLGCPVPIARFVARTDLAVVALQHLVAYPGGCAFTVHLSVRRGSLDQATWDDIDESHAGGFRGASDDSLQFRVSQGCLTEIGGGASYDDRHYRGDRQLWLSPLPAGPFEFSVEWRRAGLGRAATTIDGRAIAEAAANAQPYWP
ncbi:hypothetical protein Amsp01_077950 [Amycolatopsis sp. NBRC 101858]|uniref:hypothetical protein n=1 Tax=Amycolatopsis sp. NBRC 101858 TaxID=3032200 RepID=UPI0024A4666D|nr:hypothetical protein [Amycolatopsis sp. NBRC 101858]GLY41772.1 hypothetical protein Amsp01_077950 [Amycolatopsis sp. NBRC 101858]